MGIQVIPMNYSGVKYDIIDKAIECIQQSGLTYKVCPFETVIEGESEKVMALILKIQECCYQNGCEELITNIRIHSKQNKDVLISEKLYKYE